ncbi:MAG: DUF1156 domain-containing protein [Proteobacteria bacterium]|nr:DUF1156 domain-containing protein [Pseudomonadota bacterium]MBU4294788.1 DUF1156 domain-containing protein [Pseudomonadota bacterium]MCG2746359.1 DUF1156 domain-containing protein [Desulfobulbaceae bacterium]
MTDYPKKLIEVALPLDDINVAAAREKSIRHGHPSTLHLWWARRPLAAARAVLFAQLVNDPGGKRGYGAYKGQTKKDALRERELLFALIRELVKWENTNNEEVLERARVEIRKSWRETCAITGDDPETMPPFLDPFAGGGTIPLEAQRLGLEAHASDLNPVAVMINKAMIEIPPKFAGRKPVGPEPEGPKQRKTYEEDWSGTKGLAEDVRRYGHWMRQEAWKRIGHLYPEVDLPREQGGGKATVIAWLWARTVRSPNPAFSDIHVPLVSSFFLSTKKGKEAYVQPVVEGNSYSFTIIKGKPANPEAVKVGTKLGRGANFRCLLSDTPIAPDYIKAEGKAGRMGVRLMAVVAEGAKGRVYLSPTSEMEDIARQAEPTWKPDQMLPDDARNFWTVNYGLDKYSKLFTSRQLVALTTFSDLVLEARERVIDDAKRADWEDDGIGLHAGGGGVTAYGDAISLYLALNVSRLANRCSSICFWDTKGENVQQVFARQAIPMTWDYTEGNPFSSSSGNFIGQLGYLTKVIENLPAGHCKAQVIQCDAVSASFLQKSIFSTDPPYYDNIGYADLSDFFYVWLRRSLKPLLPDIFTTMLVPKEPELVATPYRHGSKAKAEQFFMDGMTRAIHNMAINAHPALPVTIYYAFKQSETKETGTSSTGWETFLEAVKKASFAITGTWPMRTEYTGNLKKKVNALASSIVLVCRKRPQDAPTISRKQFLRELDEILPEALEEMIGGSEGISPIAPVDLAQAAIGPGMAVFSRYEAVLEADGSPMSVHSALILINKAIDEYFSHAESNMDSDTRFCVDWFLQYGFDAGQFGEADVLARAKGTTVDGVAQAGVLQSGGGKVRLLRTDEYPADWDPQRDKRMPVWEACHQLCRALKTSETVAGELLAGMPDKGEPVRQLAYRLYTQCERKGWAETARAYNELITSWQAILEESRKAAKPGVPTLPGFGN